ncbi:VIVIPAROUS1 isoform A [Chlorella sorokiniana]|uniref:VIVIPAROUS1 isoform A n=1 Tax=Chlorella sorokiniana TaxID=3076 RepID=A0A2P6TNB6_CHLSO|nr:VIVIPAROUS1 isoform B [Chlorella sorokiniana]PRW50818.1 VIVIPAROUS1 isoform A [Chlorella sorokiniana]|eukprot:PRW50817.1 VIVIPAROUS1 isoform B [Chlorella sorokiniana]
MSSSEGSASHLPALSGGSAGSMSAAEPAILVSKVLTYSDVSTEVARTGRIVLPRIQVQQCLPELLRLCRAEHALPAVRSGGPVKLSVDLVVDDEAGRTWTILMKTWQNVVSGEHRPTFVLENTADFVRANRLCQGDTLAFCPAGGRMLLRTSLRADQLLPKQAKRGSNAAAAARRRAAAKPVLAAAPWEMPAEPLAGRKRKAELLSAADGWAATGGCCYSPAEAAQALLEMHCSASPVSSQSEQMRLGHSSDVDDAAGPKRAAKRAASPPTPPTEPAHHPIYRPAAVLGAALLAQQQQQQPAAGVPVPAAFCTQAALQSLASQPCAASAELPAPLPLSSTAQPAAAGSLPANALAQAHAWLAAVLAQQQQERKWVEQYNRLLLLQALQQEQEQQRQRLMAAAAMQAP